MRATLSHKNARLILFSVLTMLLLVSGCGNSASLNPVSTVSPVVSPSVSSPVSGETRQYQYGALTLSVSGVLTDRQETMLDEGVEEWTYTVVTCAPGAVLTVVDADMSDPACASDGQAHPQWGVLSFANGQEERLKLSDGMDGIMITENTAGVFNLESSLYLLKFELKQ